MGHHLPEPMAQNDFDGSAVVLLIQPSSILRHLHVLGQVT